MKKFNNRSTQTKQPVLLNSKVGTISVTPKNGYSPMVTYSEQELAVLLKSDPSFMANDAKNYTDAQYVRAMCEIYVSVIENCTEKLNNIKHFSIENLEKAIFKLSKEHPNEYRNLCNRFGIDIKKHRSTKRCYNDNFSDILQLSSWGYLELFFPNFQTTIENIAKKMYSKNSKMSAVEKAKYGHLFYLFIHSFNTMPYDLYRYLELFNSAEKLKKLSQADKQNLFNLALQEMHQQEKKTIYEAIVLDEIWKKFFKSKPNGSINIDAIKYFINEVIDLEYSLQIKEFLNLLTEDEAKHFKALGLKPLNYNEEVRELKEKIFPTGGWYTSTQVFLRFKKQNKESVKFALAAVSAWRKHLKKGSQFGNGVPCYKKPLTFKHIMTGLSYTYIGYLYARSPMTIRISDENELHMIGYYVNNLKL